MRPPAPAEFIHSAGTLPLVASRLVEEFYRPAVITAIDEGLVRASGRSIRQFHLVGALYQCQEFFSRFGGHPQAAGFVMDREKLPLLEDQLTTIASQILAGIKLAPTLEIDAEVRPTDLMGDTYKRLIGLEPFRADNPVPVFLSRNLRLLEARRMGNQRRHLRLKLTDGGAT